MNVSAVSAFIESKYRELPDGIELYKNEDGAILFPIRGKAHKPDHYVMYFVKRTLLFEGKVGETVSKFGVRIPDHSELGASRLGWQSKLKKLLDDSLAQFQKELKK